MSKSQYVISILLLSGQLVSSAMEGNTINGRAVSIEKYPHSVLTAIDCFEFSKQSSLEGSVEYFGCGSSIINQNVLLSAAHCFSTCVFNRSKISAMVGASMRHKIIIKVVSIKLHELFSESDLSNDIALLLLKKPLQFNKTAKKVLLATNPPRDLVAYVAGWGYVDEERQIESMGLNEVTQKVLPHELCVNIFNYFPTSAMCTSSISGYSAEGDSGSALVLRGYIQIGLVSYKILEVSKSIVIYTNVTKFINWIHSNSLKIQCNRANGMHKENSN